MDFRLFKLNRMDQVQISENTFSKRQAPMLNLGREQISPGGIAVKALFEPACKWRLVEEFGPGCFTVQDDGRLLFQEDYMDQERLITWMLSFRDQVCLLEPEEICAELREQISRMIKNYE